VVSPLRREDVSRDLFVLGLASELVAGVAWLILPDGEQGLVAALAVVACGALVASAAVRRVRTAV